MIFVQMSAVLKALYIFLSCLMAAAGKGGEGGNDASRYEVILSATSSDGRTFVQEAGNRLTGGYVDPYVLRAQEGDWLMLVATTPSSNRLPQKIYMASSTNGLDWQVDTNVLIEVNGGNALDPTATLLSNGTFRVYYIATPNPDPFQDFYLASGILSSNQNGKWSFTADNVPFGIYGVSPEAWSLGGNTVRLYITSSSGGIKAYRAEDGLSFIEEAGTLPQGSDPTVIELNDQRLRMYYINLNEAGMKEIYTALSVDGLNWTAEGSTGIASSNSLEMAWGVPDSVTGPDGSVKLFWVAMPQVNSVASPVPVFSLAVGGIYAGRIQLDGVGAAASFIGLSALQWSAYRLIGATVHAPDHIKVVLVDQASGVPYLVQADEDNNWLEHAPLFGLSDSALWSSYAVEAAADFNADGVVEYVIRERNSGYTFLAYTAGSTNELQNTGNVLGIDPALLAAYRVEGAGDISGDGFADLAVRDPLSNMLYLVRNDRAGGYNLVLQMFGMSAETWSQYHLESTGDFNDDGYLDYVFLNADHTTAYKVFGADNSGFSSIEIIP